MLNDKRNASLDLLRLLAMMMIVSLHYFGWGGINHATQALVINKGIASVGSIVCRSSVDVFFLLSGYLMLEKKTKIEITANNIFRKVRRL